MRAILINPNDQTINSIDIGEDYREINRLVGCDLFTSVPLGPNTVMFVDDEALIKVSETPKDEHHYFVLLDHALQPYHFICGKALILDYDKEGESVSTTMSLDLLRKLIKWVPKERALEANMFCQSLLESNCVVTSESEWQAAARTHKALMARGLELTKPISPGLA